MENEMMKSQNIEDAFKAIKTATGIVDVQEIVKKFLTREQTYSQLLVNVSESESKIDRLKRDNDELRNRLHDLKMDSESAAQDGDVVQDDDVMEMRQAIT